MRFADYIIMALRNIGRSKLRSSLTIFAVVIGATSITIMLAAVFSLKSFMTKQFEANGTFQQILVSPQTDISWGSYSDNNCQDCVKLTDDLAAKVGQLQHVAGVARQTNVGSFQVLTLGNQKVRLQGITAYDANGVVTNNVLAGRDIGPGDSTGVITITSDYADKLGYKHNYQALVGKQIGLVTQGWYTGVGADPVQQFQAQQAWFSAHPGANGQDYQPAPVTLTATIVGVTDSLDHGYTVRVPLAWARGMEETQNYTAQQTCGLAGCRQGAGQITTEDMLAKTGYSSLVIKADRSSNAPDVAKTIRNQFHVGAADAQTAIKQQLAVFNILGLVLGGIGGIALVVAAVGVVNTMIMSILERTREIGVMRAVGARRGTVSRLFTFEAGLLGFFGGVIGLGAGWALVLIANPLINKQLKNNGIHSANIIALPLWLILGVVALTTVIGILAGLYPARRAAKLNPVDALHYE